MSHAATAERWNVLRRRLDQIASAVEALHSPAEVQAILSDRARALAKRPEREGGTANAGMYVLVRLEQDRYALPAALVREVFRPAEAALLSGAERPLVAVVAHRGELVALLDVRETTIGDGDPGEAWMAVAIDHAGKRAALVVDELLGVQMIAPETIHEVPAAGRVPATGVTTDGTLLLDPRALTRA
jgi:chemotaxis signal transduction protein